jgi:hypothetical protein
MKAKESRKKNSDAAFGIIFRLSNQFHRSQKLYDYFSLSQDILKIHKQSVDVNKDWFDLIRLQQIIFWGGEKFHYLEEL